MRPFSVAGTCVLLTVLAAIGTSASGTEATVTVDPSTRYQTIEAWGATTPGGTMPDALRREMIDLAVNEWGLTRLRFEGNQGNCADRGRSIEWTNDNADPLVANQAALSWDYVDWRARNWLVPFKRAVEADGDPFTLYVSFSFFDRGGSGAAPVWLLRSPGEHGEYMLDLLKRLRDVHGVTADYCTVINEPRNQNGFDAAVQAADIKALAPRLRGEGFPNTKIEFPEGVNVGNALRDMEALRDDDAVWRQVGLVAYHRYGGTQQLTQLRDLAFAKGKRTGQTEAGTLNMDVLYEDLTAGGCSVWEVYIWGALYKGSMFSYNPDGTSFTRRGAYWELQQVMRHVRPGAVRIGAASSADPQVRALAFDQRGAVTAILYNRGNESCEVTVSGLPAGVYGVTRAGDRPVSYAERGLQTASAPGAALVVTMPPHTVSALYPHGSHEPGPRAHALAGGALVPDRAELGNAAVGGGHRPGMRPGRLRMECHQRAGGGVGTAGDARGGRDAGRRADGPGRLRLPSGGQRPDAHRHEGGAAEGTRGERAACGVEYAQSDPGANLPAGGPNRAEERGYGPGGGCPELPLERCEPAARGQRFAGHSCGHPVRRIQHDRGGGIRLPVRRLGDGQSRQQGLPDADRARLPGQHAVRHPLRDGRAVNGRPAREQCAPDRQDAR